MKQSRFYQPHDSIYPFKGLNTQDPSTLSDPRYSPSCENVYSDKGVIVKRPGLEELIDSIPGKLLGLINYQPSTAVLTTFAICSEHQYRYNESLSEWIDCHNVILSSDETGWADSTGGDVTISNANITLSDIDGDGSTATATSSSAHHLQAGDSVTITGSTNFNGTFTILTVPTSTTFTFSHSSSETNETGTANISPGGWCKIDIAAGAGIEKLCAIDYSAGVKDVSQSNALVFQLKGSAAKSADVFRLKLLENDVTITDIDGAAGTATATATDHGYSSGDYVRISGSTHFDGDYEITVTNDNTFTFSHASSETNETGTANRYCYNNTDSTTYFDFPAVTTSSARSYHTVDLSSYTEVAYVEIWSSEAPGAYTLYVKNLFTLCEWSGEEDTWVDHAEGIDDNGEYFFATNGDSSDKMLVWDGNNMHFFGDGASADDQEVTGLSISNHIKGIRTVAIYLGALVIGNYWIDGVEYENAIAYSLPGSFFDFSTSGSDIVEYDAVQGGVQRVHPYMEALVVYGKTSIGMVRYLRGDVTYIFDQISEGETRLLSGAGVISLGPYHAVMMLDNIYLFNGTKELLPIADEIVPSYEKAFELEEAEKSFCFNDFHRKRAYFVINQSDGQKVFILDYGDFTLKRFKAWTEFSFSKDILCFGFYTTEPTYTWDGTFLSGRTWEDLALTWEDMRFNESFPQTVIGMDNDTTPATSSIYVIDGKIHADDGSDVTGYWESIDFTLPEDFQSVKARWIEGEIELKGDATVYYSIDKGASWNTIATVSNLNRDVSQLLFDTVSKHIRIKVETTSVFDLYWLRLWYTRGGV